MVVEVHQNDSLKILKTKQNQLIAAMGISNKSLHVREIDIVSFKKIEKNKQINCW